MTRTLDVLLVVSLATSALTAQSTHTVDAGGGGDFTEISAAVAAANAGDLLIVNAGNYNGFVLDKQLTIVGSHPDKPTVWGLTDIVSPAGATLAGLSLTRVNVLGCADTLLFDEVVVTGGGSTDCLTFKIDDSLDVRLDGCVIYGKDGDFACESVGIHIERSHVVITDSLVEGGDGWGDTFDGYDGRPGLDVAAGAHVDLAATSVHGGTGGTPDVIISGMGGDGAPAIAIEASATVILRGTNEHLIYGGPGGGGGFPGWSPPSVTGTGTLLWGGCVFFPAPSHTLDITLADPSWPFTRLTGESTPGGLLRVHAYGPPGVSQLLVGSFFADKLDVHPVQGSLYLDPGSTFLMLPFQTISDDVGFNIVLPVPDLPTLLGLPIHLQSFGKDLGNHGKWLASNPMMAILR